ncbi:MAG: ABC-F family ATP-binding cassette domain-containing protein [Dehalococcoidaceae bacterium]|nr:ABC-F family ATP-binding cassette domain-containing protein [Dehalococcoidaceae bacterium]
MLSITNISKSFGSRELFGGLSLTVGANDRFAIIGANGSGKTTLFEIIAGNITPDEGTLTLRRGSTVGYLCQDARAPARINLLEYVSQSREAVSTLSHKIQILRDELAEEADDAIIAGLLARLGELQDQYDSKGGYDSEHEAKIILSGLGFGKIDFERRPSEFSGGWQTRIELARLLYSNPDILLLDEPTNHLDLETQRWFENFLKQYHGSILFTSHDRAFLNNIAEKIIALESDEIVYFHGGYDSYILARQKDIKARIATAQRQQQNINRQMRFIERFRAKATKATQVQSRIKQLEKIKPVKVPRLTKKIHFDFPEPPRSGHQVLELAGIAKSYGEHVVYRDLNLVLEKGDRAAIVGINGAGKTTLLRILAGVLDYEKGTRIPGHNVTIAYFAQYYIEMLNPLNTVLEELRSVAPGEPEQRLRGLLGAFLFTGDDVDKHVSILSGGEKTRLAIAKLLTRPANFILMDEPTNHLDIPSREVLADALGSYKGTLCFVTHDRTLIREIANKIIEVRAGRIKVYAGNYDQYLQQCEPYADSSNITNGSAGTTQSKSPPAAFTKRQLKSREGQLRNEHYRLIAPLNKKITDIEARVETVAENIRDIERLMGDPAHYENSENVICTNRKYQEFKMSLSMLTQEWDELTDRVEGLTREFQQALQELK